MKRSIHFAAIAALALSGSAFAQTQPWDTNVIRVTHSTTCADGRPITACPITGVRIEHSLTRTGPWENLTTLSPTTLSYSHTSVGAGEHCYRAIWLSANGTSTYANVQPCVLNTAPIPPTVPNPGTISVTAGVPALANRSPVYSLSGKQVSTFYGLIPPGRKVGKVLAAHEGLAFCEYDGIRTELWKQPPTRGTLVAACRAAG